MSLFMPDIGLVFWMLVAFGITFFILAKWGWPVITNMADKRADFISESIKSAKEASKQMETLKLDMKSMIDKANEEQVRILKDAALSRDKILSDAKQKAISEADKIIADTKRQIEIERENILNEIRVQVAELSVNIAEKVIRKELSNENKQLSIIENMFDEINKLNN